MRKNIFVLSLLLFSAFLSVPAFAANIPIVNYSFEDPVTTSYTHGDIPGWISGNSGYLGVITGYGTASDGVNAAWVQSPDTNVVNWISQVLTTTLQPDSLYTLKVSVGNRLGPWAPDAEIQLLAGGGVLTDKILTDPEKPAEGISNGTFSFYTLTYQSGKVVEPGQKLEIKLISTGDPDGWYSQPHFDDVTLDGPLSSASVVPEPATASLVGLGLLGLVFKRRKTSSL